jgi:hypothetical protein
MPKVASYRAKITVNRDCHIAVLDDKVLKTLVNHDASINGVDGFYVFHTYS